VPRTITILVTGPYGAGKTEFVRAVSDLPIVATEKNISNPQDSSEKKTTTVAMDYGRVTLGSTRIHLRGTPGQARFDFMRQILAHKVNGTLFLLDAGNPSSFDDAVDIMKSMGELRKLPHAIVANKYDLKGAIHPDQIRKRLKLPDNIPVLTCSSLSREQATQVLHEFLKLFPI
jgi:uncharacterized protein